MALYCVLAAGVRVFGPPSAILSGRGRAFHGLTHTRSRWGEGWFSTGIRKGLYLPKILPNRRMRSGEGVAFGSDRREGVRPMASGSGIPGGVPEEISTNLPKSRTLDLDRCVEAAGFSFEV